MKGILVRVVLAVAAAALLLLMGSAAAAPGDLDPSFGDEGVVTTDVGPNDLAKQIVVQPDGKILVAGSGTTDAWAVIRYFPDGSLDDSFGVGGKVVTPAPPGVASALTLAPDGKIVVAGWGIVARYLATGALDASFGTGGLASVGLGNVVLNGIVMLPDGKMLVAGQRYAASVSDFVVARLTPNGALDTSFGEGGSVITDLGGYDQASALLLLPDGRFIAVGESVGTTSDFALVRYLPNGSLDPSFGSDGKVITDVGGWDHGDDAVLTPDGKIVVTGASYPNITLARYLPDGSLDPTFGMNGVVVAGSGEAWSVAQKPDGSLVVTTGTLAAARFTPDGVLDSTFGNGGIADPGLEGTGRAVAVDAQGKIIVGGAINGDFALVRYLGQAGPPENDAFADAVTLDPAIATPLVGTNVFATKELGEPPHGSDAGGASVWYSWTPPFSGVAFVSTEGSDFDTTLGVYTGSSVTSLTTIASNDDSHQVNSSSLVCFATTEGTPYRIAVDGYAAALGYDGAQGDIELSWGQYTSTDPCPTLPPTVTGNPAVGGALTAANGTWAGSLAGFEYQWLRCRDIACATIAGATETTYRPTQTDIGANLIVRVTALHPTDPSLDAINYSTRTATIPAPPSPPGGGGGGGGGAGASIPDLRVTLSGSTASVQPNGEVDVTATIANLGGAGSLQTHLRVALPATMTLLGPPVSDRGQGCTGGQTIDCNLDYIPNGGAATVRFAVRVSGSGPQSLSATATADREANPADNTATLTVNVTAPPPQPPPPAAVLPVIGKPVTTPKILQAGKRAVVSFRVTRTDTHGLLTSGRMICDPAVNGHVIRHAETFKNGIATLRFTIPKSAKHKLLKVRLTIKLGGQAATRVSSFRIH